MIIDTIQGSPIYYDKGIVYFIGDADIDSDGGKNVDDDKYWQPDTALHYGGKPIDALKVPGVVVPPVVLHATKEIVLGSLVAAFNAQSGLWANAVVMDIGPARKIGEITPALAVLLGLNPNANHGGTDERVISYTIFCGVAAKVRGVQYKLQPWR